MASILISVVSLLLSLTVAWLTLFRRGNLGMTQPMLIGFLYENDQPKIFFRAMLYATGKRGHIIEALYLKVRRGESTQTFNFWMYGETKDLKIGSGLRVGEDGASFNHHFLPPKDVSSFAFLAGVAAERFFGFFTAHIRNKNTRRAYYKAACRFADWCEGRGLKGLAHIKPPHVARYIEWLSAAEPEGQELSKPTVKQHLAALRMLFDWLVVGHVLDTNPAHAVRGPKYSQKKGRTPVLDRDEARALIAAINTASITGLRDRALIAVMIYTFARVGAALQMRVGDYFSQGRRGWVRLHEKGGKEHEAPCVPKLEAYLDEYIAAAGIGNDADGPLFRTTGRSTGKKHRLTQQDAYRLIQRHAKRAGIATRIGNAHESECDPGAAPDSGCRERSGPGASAVLRRDAGPTFGSAAIPRAHGRVGAGRVRCAGADPGRLRHLRRDGLRHIAPYARDWHSHGDRREPGPGARHRGAPCAAADWLG
jgi:integrase/recombinase XerD